MLSDDGINYSEYVTELVLLLFIKMVYENTQAGLLNALALPKARAGWISLVARARNCSTTTSRCCSTVANLVDAVNLAVQRLI